MKKIIKGAVIGACVLFVMVLVEYMLFRSGKLELNSLSIGNAYYDEILRNIYVQHPAFALSAATFQGALIGGIIAAWMNGNDKRRAQEKVIDKKLFFIDAETDGLYGRFISAAVIITDSKCNELERHYWGINVNSEDIESNWVKDNVLPVMGNDYEQCGNEDELIENVWNLWNKYGQDAYVVADVAFPVEARLFEKCILADREAREYNGPFPLVDVSSLLIARGIEPLTDRKTYSGLDNKKQHRAIEDVEMMVAMWKKIFNLNKNKKA